MMIFRRLILLGLFTAMGVGLALWFGLSPNSPLNPDSPWDLGRPLRPTSNDAVPAAASVPAVSPPSTAVATNVSTVSATPAPAYRAAYPSQSQPPMVVPPGPIVAEPRPAIAYQQSPELSTSRLLEALEFVRDRLGPATPESAPMPVEQPPAAEQVDAADDGGVSTDTNASDRLVPTNSPVVRSKLGEGDNELTMHFYKDDLGAVLELLSEQGNLNILASNSVQGTVTATLNGVDVETALDAILKSTGFVARREGNFVYVGTPEDFEDIEETLDEIGTRVYRPNYVTASELEALVTPLLTADVGVVSVSTASEVGIQADDSTAGGDAFAGSDVILVRDYEAVLAQIDQVVAEIDVRPVQVAIEAMILSVTLDDEDKLGMNFELLRNHPNIRFGLGTPEDILPATLQNGGLEFAFIDSSVSAFVDALEAIKDTNVIATPRLVVLNKHRAEIQIGKEEGYVSTTVTETSSSQSVEFLSTGTILRFRPFVSSDGIIRMEVHPELSSGEVKLKGEFTLPEKNVTQVTTNIMVRDGCTVIIGGLLREQIVNNTTQIPLFGSLPLVGPAFRQTKEETDRDEILVLITPHIMYEPETCQEGDKAAGEFHRRQQVYKDKMSLFSKRSIARRYFRLAQNAWAAGDRNNGLRFAEMAVHFDPLNRAAIDLRSNIWLGESVGDHTLGGPMTASPISAPLDGGQIAPWVLDDLQREPLPAATLLHPLDPGMPGRHTDVTRPRSLE